MLREAERQNDGIKMCVYYETVLTPREIEELKRTRGPKRDDIRKTFDIANRVIEDMKYIPGYIRPFASVFQNRRETRDVCL